MMVTAAYRSKMVGCLAIVVALLILVGCGASGTGGGQANLPTDRAPTAQPTQMATSGAREPTSVATPASHGGPVKDQVSLIDALRKAGATVTPDDTVEQPFLSVAGTQLSVNGADVQVFEYADDAAAQADAAKLTDALAGRGTVMITWVASPHAYRAGRVIVLYVGDDPAILKLLQGVLGAPVAEQHIPSNQHGGFGYADSCQPRRRTGR